MATFGPVNFWEEALPRYGLRAEFPPRRIMFAVRKLVRDLGLAVSMIVDGTAPLGLRLGALVFPAVHELVARVRAFYVANALMALPLDLVATTRLPVVNHLLAQKCALVLEAGLPPLMAAFAEPEIDLLFANLYCGILVARLLSGVIAAREIKGNLRLAL